MDASMRLSGIGSGLPRPSTTALPSTVPRNLGTSTRPADVAANARTMAAAAPANSTLSFVSSMIFGRSKVLDEAMASIRQHAEASSNPNLTIILRGMGLALSSILAMAGQAVCLVGTAFLGVLCAFASVPSGVFLYLALSNDGAQSFMKTISAMGQALSLSWVFKEASLALMGASTHEDLADITRAPLEENIHTLADVGAVTGLTAGVLAKVLGSVASAIIQGN